ncbi:uncharacterized protein DNG_01418 [Cephalotrichum gorgonifer]|uniref:T6SS Phospholipase effector Tle1-like catalytic domain-containing protein n=1 Tax=Cephalotrichum gorgonifer TaxID=2041049 RepID=A0AAE8SRM1_9PEZI|nr:uncharacterized protein DNG_01418 [Cephalotrichum gorgonifer]
MATTRKRLIMCCDGTWMNSDKGGEEGGPFWNPTVTLQVPSNVTRISRSFRRICTDGRIQIINYESGVGTGSNKLDSLTGGAFGVGLSERVREAYQFICANYDDGDEIILIGFSRGAYTVRSVAGMIGEIGLLTREGLDLFYPIFKDMENWMDDDYEDPFPTLPFSEKPKGPGASGEYKARLERLGFTRVREAGGTGNLITVKAIGVWDTALALDETRPPFSPAVWERLPNDSTDLRQVWFPGNHGNVGGGWADQNIANITLAWMMDQLASIGVEFDEKSLQRLFNKQINHYKTLVPPKKEKPFAVDQIHLPNKPIRPWALGSIHRATNPLYTLAGKAPRTPGLYKQIDGKTNTTKAEFLLDTNERIHASVRVRLACRGLGLDDGAVWEAEALKKWKLVRTKGSLHGTNGAGNQQNGGSNGANGNGKAKEIQTWGPPAEEQEVISDEGGWEWEYAGPERDAPPVKRMAEAKMGPYEKYWLKLAGGSPNAYHFAAARE